MKLTVNIENTTDVLKKFKEFGEEAVKDFKEITKFKAMDIAADAKIIANSKYIHDKGNLIQGIRHKMPLGDDSGLRWNIVAEEPYSAYHEFGTGTEVDIPSGWEEIAMEFKGAGIRKVNIRPRPFLYPAFKYGSKFYISDLQKALHELTKKYNE